MADPTPVAFALFAFALAVYGVRFVNVSAFTVAAAPTTIALDYAILVAAIAETLVGVLAVIRGLAYRGYVTTIFGIWLLGFYLLITSGAANKAFTPDALAWYVLVLVVPVALLAVPSIVHRNIPFIIAFVAILVLLLLLVDQVLHRDRLRRLGTLDLDRRLDAGCRTVFAQKRRSAWRCPLSDRQQVTATARERKQLLLGTRTKATFTDHLAAFVVENGRCHDLSRSGRAEIGQNSQAAVEYRF